MSGRGEVDQLDVDRGIQRRQRPASVGEGSGGWVEVKRADPQHAGRVAGRDVGVVESVRGGDRVVGLFE